MLDGFYNRVLERVILPVGDKIEGGECMRWLSQYRTEQWLPGEQLRDLLRVRLSKMLKHARSRVPYYASLSSGSKDPFEDIKRFPIMSKLDVKEGLDQLLAAPKERLIAESSSGSSGVQGTVYMDKSALASTRAMQLVWFEWSGYRIGNTILQTGITPERGFIKRVKDVMLRTNYIPAFNLENVRLEALLRDLQRDPREFLFGYASSLYLLARTALELGISDVRFNHAVSWGDKLFPHYREKIRAAFGCETLDLYACTEGAMIAAQCREGRYHLGINQCYVEVVDANGDDVPPGQMGRVLATRLDNFAMPLIRYELGDLVELETSDAGPCECGRQLPLLRRLIGRDTDIVVTRSGKRMIVHFFTGIFEHVPEIRQFKVVQRHLDEIEIHFVRNGHFDQQVIETVQTRIHGHLQEKFPIRWVETDRILPTNSGKPQIIQSFLDRSRLPGARPNECGLSS